MSLTVGVKDNISFATVNIVGSANEDRACSNFNHEVNKPTGIASFGVFDGHNGYQAAQTCAKDLHQNIVQIYSELKEKNKLLYFKSESDVESLKTNSPPEDWISLLTECEQDDSLFCKAINQAIFQLNKEVRTVTPAGCTAVSLFFRPLNCVTEKNSLSHNFYGSSVHPVRGSVDDFTSLSSHASVHSKTSGQNHETHGLRVICSNTGDSRCLMIAANMETDVKSHRTSYFGRNSKRPSRSNSFFKSKQTPSSSPDFIKLDQMRLSPSQNFIRKKVDGENVDESNHSYFVGDVPSSPSVQLEISSNSGDSEREISISPSLVHLSEDHNLTCFRDRKRIDHKIQLKPTNFPICMKNPCTNSEKPEFNNCDCYSFSFENDTDLVFSMGINGIKQRNENKSDKIKEILENDELIKEIKNEISVDFSTNLCKKTIFNQPKELLFDDKSLIFPSARTQDEIMKRNEFLIKSYAAKKLVNLMNGLKIENLDESTTRVSLNEKSVIKEFPLLNGSAGLGNNTEDLQTLWEDEDDDLDKKDGENEESLDIPEEDKIAEFLTKSLKAKKSSGDKLSSEYVENLNEEEAEEIHSTYLSPRSETETENDPKTETEKVLHLRTENETESESDMKELGLGDIVSVGGMNLKVIRKESFVARRSGADGVPRGPFAYFGIFGPSLLMTRSIGDIFGPRGCVATPDITSLTIYPKQHVRFILASDGVWDVLTSETVRQWSLSKQHGETARDLAVYLSLKARRRRARLQMRMDDITVTVIDVNPQHALLVKCAGAKNKPGKFYPASFPSLSNRSSLKTPVKGLSPAVSINELDGKVTNSSNHGRVLGVKSSTQTDFNKKQTSAMKKENSISSFSGDQDSPIVSVITKPYGTKKVLNHIRLPNTVIVGNNSTGENSLNLQLPEKTNKRSELADTPCTIPISDNSVHSGSIQNSTHGDVGRLAEFEGENEVNHGEIRSYMLPKRDLSGSKQCQIM